MKVQLPAFPPAPWEEPELNEALTNQTVWVISKAEPAPKETNVFLMRGALTTTGRPVRTPQAYKLSKRTPFYTTPWGVLSIRKDLYKARILEFVRHLPDGRPVFFDRAAEEAHMVVIKRIGRYVYDIPRSCRYFEPWVHENPYNEIAAMRFLNPTCSPDHCAIGCIDALRDDDHIFIVTPFLSESDLYSKIPWYNPRRRSRRRGGLPEEDARPLFLKIVSKLGQLHLRGVVHFDVKGENICFTENMEPVLIDFAQSHQVQGSATNGTTHFMQNNPNAPFGTPQFRAPEVEVDQEINPYAIDVWSLGVTLWTLLTGEHLYQDPFDDQYVHFFQNQGLMALNRLTPEARALLSGMLDPAASRRLTLQQVEEHPWFHPV